MVLNGSPTLSRPSALAQKSAPLSCRLARTASTSGLHSRVTTPNPRPSLWRQRPASAAPLHDRTERRRLQAV